MAYKFKAAIVTYELSRLWAGQVAALFGRLTAPVVCSHNELRH